jgi:hypothetical protein
MGNHFHLLVRIKSVEETEEVCQSYETSKILQTEGGSTGLTKHIPILSWLPRYQPDWLRADLIAAIVIPRPMTCANVGLCAGWGSSVRWG